MQRIAYTVLATCPDPAMADDYVAWLEDGHVDAVIQGGAHSAMIVRLDPEPGSASPTRRVEVRYIFSTREVFDRYIQHFAPALRADGLKRFPQPPDPRAVTFVRTIGEIV